MSTDRELLEMAAKAAGLEPGNDVWQYAWNPQADCLVRRNANGSDTAWNPLTDDGDALRLAVKLRLDLYNYGPPVHDEAHVDAIHMDGATFGEATEELGDDPYAATRRAVVRAAAEIGKAMP